MSDDEGGDYGDYEDLGVGEEDPVDDEGLADVADPEIEVDAVDDEEAEIGLEEDAAGTDEDEEDDEAGDEDADPIEPVPQKARPERQKVDPILRISNKHRFIHVVPPEDRVTDHRLQKPEAAYIIGMRAQQIALYATRYTEGASLHDPVMLAYKELLDRRCPFILRRPVGTGPNGELLIEEWTVREMTLPPLTAPVPLGGGPTAPGPQAAAPKR
jgi:hypothetical protein